MTPADIKSIYENVYQGQTWYGKNIHTTLQDIPIGKAVLRLDGSYNIVELVYHMITWRTYVIKVLQTGQHHPVSEIENFPTVEMILMEDWTELIDQLAQTQELLMDLLESAHIDLHVMVPGKPYSFKDVLLGIIHHDIYHAGQLNFLAKFL